MASLSATQWSSPHTVCTAVCLRIEMRLLEGELLALEERGEERKFNSREEPIGLSHRLLHWGEGLIPPDPGLLFLISPGTSNSRFLHSPIAQWQVGVQEQEGTL